MFNELDADGKGVIGILELRRAIARVAGQREVREQDVLTVLERLNKDDPTRGLGPLLPDEYDNVGLERFRQILDQVDPSEFAIQARLKEWLGSVGILDAFAQELERFVKKDGVSHRDVLLSVSELSHTQVNDVCDNIRTRVGPMMTEAVARLKGMSTVLYNPVEANQKFAMMDGAFTGSFAEVNEFFKGLDGHIGLPSPRVFEMMELEHTASADSKDPFITSNYGGTETHPALEWEFVNNPVPSKQYPGILRKPLDLDIFLKHETARQARLEKAEIIALRLFTGPMFMKYNAKLRNAPEAGVKALKGNGYVTTIHAVVSAVLKLSRIWKLPHDRKVFRGLGGMLLPDKFWNEDKYGCRGGVEFALMSTTIKRDVAIQYSGQELGRPTIFEIEVGQVDRGASLSWVSQYPMEEEIVMPPLSNLEVVGDARMEESEHGLIMVIPLRINVNLKSLTINELKERRKLLHLSMMENLLQEAQRDLTEEVTRHNPNLVDNQVQDNSSVASGGSAPPSAPQSVAGSSQQNDSLQAKVQEMLSDFNHLLSETHKLDASFFNNDDNYKDAMTSALHMKSGTLRKFEELNSPRIHTMSLDVQKRIRESNCSDWAREGTVYRIISNTSAFPWEAVAEGQVNEVELKPSLNDDQAAVAWEALKANLEAGEDNKVQPVEYVTIRGLEGKAGKIKVHDAIKGSIFALQTEKVGLHGQRKLETHGMGPEGVRLLLPLLQMNQTLTRIDLSKSTMGVDLAKELAQVLSQNSNLEWIKIRGPIPINKARNQADLDLSSRNRHTPTAASLRWANIRNQSSFGGLRRLSSNTQQQNGSSLSQMRATTLTRVSTRAPGRGVDAWEPCDVEGGIVLSAFIANNCNMTKLDLEGNRIGPEGATALAEVLCSVTKLHFLNMRDNNICASGATAISEALIKHRKLKHLDLRDNRTGASGPGKLAPAIKANENLTNLNAVEMDPHGDSGGWVVRKMTDPAYEMVFVAGRLLRMDNVTSLDLSESQLGYEGAKLLFPALQNCTNLQHLVLRGNALRSAGAAEIAPAFTACVKLEYLDLSYNSIDQGEGTKAIAKALDGHPALRSLVYTENIVEGFIEWSICFTRYRQPYRVLCSAVPRCQVTFFTGTQVRHAVMSWCWISGASLAFFTGIIGAPIAWARGQPLYSFGIMGIGVAGFLGVGGWILWRRLLRRLGIIDCFVRIVQRQQASQESADHNESDSDGSPHPGGNADLVYSLSPARDGTNAVIPIGRGDTVSTEGVELVTTRGNNSHTNIPSANPNSTTHNHAIMALPTSADAEAEADEPVEDPQEFANALSEKIGVLQIPMLLEQYVSNTKDPASLDQEMMEQYHYMQTNWTVGSFFHSPTPLALALRAKTVKLMLLLFFVYCGTVFCLFLWPWMFGDDFTYRTFRFDSHMRRGAKPATSAHISTLTVEGLYCTDLQYLNASIDFINNSVVLQYDHPVTIGKWKLETAEADTELDPETFELVGCVEPFDECEHWEEITGNITEPDFTKERGAEIWYNVTEPWQLTVLRFVPFVFGLGFLGLFYTSITNLHRYGRVVLVTTFFCAALMYAIASTPNNNFDNRLRWGSAFSLSFLPAMIAVDERYFVYGVVLYGIIYCPAVGVLFQNLYTDRTLPQWGRLIGWTNYDQLTLFPIIIISNMALIPLFARYGLYRAKIKILVEKDIEKYNKIWDALKKNGPEVLRDLKGEVDKFSNAIEQRNVTTVRHRVGCKVAPSDAHARVHGRNAKSSGGSFLNQIFQSPKEEGKEENRITSLFQVYAQAFGLEVLLRNKVQYWALLTGGSFPTSSGDFVRWDRAKEDQKLQRTLVFGELKNRTRAIEKVLRFYEGDVSKLLDVCRQMICFDSIEDLSHCLAVMRQDNEVQVVRVKNRMDPDGNQKSCKVYAGYRDVALNLRFRTDEAETLGIDGHVCEVRLVFIDLARMMQGVEGLQRHERYVAYRNSKGTS